MPGESPPDVITPILVTFFSIDLLVWVDELGGRRNVIQIACTIANLTFFSQFSADIVIHGVEVYHNLMLSWRILKRRNISSLYQLSFLVLRITSWCAIFL
jgi:hypothetical protein